MQSPPDDWDAACGFAILCGVGCVVMGLWLIYEIWR